MRLRKSRSGPKRGGPRRPGGCCGCAVMAVLVAWLMAGADAQPILPGTVPELKARQRISSLEKNPESGGTPAMAAAESVIAAQVHGSFRASPPIFRMSCSWWHAWITDPDPKKSAALKKACVTTWNMPVAMNPVPTPSIM